MALLGDSLTSSMNQRQLKFIYLQRIAILYVTNVDNLE